MGELAFKGVVHCRPNEEKHYLHFKNRSIISSSIKDILKIFEFYNFLFTLYDSIDIRRIIKFEIHF